MISSFIAIIICYFFCFSFLSFFFVFILFSVFLFCLFVFLSPCFVRVCISLLYLIVVDLNRPIAWFIFICYLPDIGLDLSHSFLLFVFILTVFRKFIFQIRKPRYLFSFLPFPRFCYLSREPGGGGGVGCMMIQTFPFLITHVGPIYFSLCS